MPLRARSLSSQGFAVFGILLCAGMGVPAHAQSAYDRIVAFGDSLSDNGNVYRVSTAAGVGVPAAPYFAGHFSNGQTWVEQLATIINAPLSDFAYGGANTDTTNSSGALLASLPGIKTEINSYLTSVGGVISDKKTLFTLWGGANDYLNMGQSNPAVPVGNLTGEITQLVNAGAQNILVVNLPNLGVLPGTSGNPAVAAGLTSLTNLHNAALLAGVNQIQSANPTVSLHLLDVNSVFTRILANPGAYGFTNATQGYVSNTGDLIPYVGARSVGTGDPNNYVFFDEIHPTQHSHTLIAQAAAGVVAPEASTVVLMLTGIGVLGMAVVRRRTVG